MLFLEKLWKTWEKHRDIKLVITEKRKNYLVSIKRFSANLLPIRMKKTQILMNKSVYLGLSI